MCFTKNEFLEIIKALQDQQDIDIYKADSIGKAIGCTLHTYDNSRLVNQLFKTLHKQFPPKNDFCDIQHFCYELNFGRALSPVKTIEQLWEELQN